MTDRCWTLVRVLLVAFLLALAGCAGSRETPGEFIDDAAITTRVKAAFVADRVVSALNISVVTDKGVVHLGGVAKTSEQENDQLTRKTSPGEFIPNSKIERRICSPAREHRDRTE